MVVLAIIVLDFTTAELVVDVDEGDDGLENLLIIVSLHIFYGRSRSERQNLGQGGQKVTEGSAFTERSPKTYQNTPG